ncbi:MAG: alcohol dehydrogenase catalytic domain-containing protein [Streptosporangiales bacterium]|nr:alcohol dehydrogenase catalytic domain-containing protein [Streptosporangiales bacterium]
MRAVRVTGRTVEAGDLPEPLPGADELLIRVGYVGVCGTDRKLAQRGANPPRVPGHEVVGLLDDGTAVGVHPDVGCGRCAACAAGYDNRCADRVTVGLSRDGGLAELVAAPAGHVVPLGGVEVANGPLLEPLACCLHAVGRLGVVAGDDVLVVGAGPMGVLCMWALQAGGSRVTVVQRSAARRALAERLGADAVLGPEDALNHAPAAAIVTAPGEEPLDYALRAVATGGRVHAFAGTPGGACLDANTVHYRHLTLVGSTGSTLADYRKAVELAGAGAIDLDRMPRTIVSLDGAARGLAEPTSDVFKLIATPGSETE